MTKRPVGIDVVLGVGIQHLRGQGRLDDVLQDVGAQLFVGDRLGVLASKPPPRRCGGLVVLVVLNCDLGFAIGPEVRKSAISADFAQAVGQLVRQRNRGRHVVGILVGGIAEHHALVAGAAGVHAHGDVARLLVDAGDDRAGVGVETVEGVVVADGGDHAAHQRLEIDISFGGDFAGNDDQAGGRERLAGHPAVRIFLDAGIEDGVGNLVGNLVRVTFGHAIRT